MIDWDLKSEKSESICGFEIGVLRLHKIYIFGGVISVVIRNNIWTFFYCFIKIYEEFYVMYKLEKENNLFNFNGTDFV